MPPHCHLKKLAPKRDEKAIVTTTSVGFSALTLRFNPNPNAMQAPEKKTIPENPLKSLVFPDEKNGQFLRTRTGSSKPALEPLVTKRNKQTLARNRTGSAKTVRLNPVSHLQKARGNPRRTRRPRIAGFFRSSASESPADEKRKKEKKNQCSTRDIEERQTESPRR